EYLEQRARVPGEVRFGSTDGEADLAARESTVTGHEEDPRRGLEGRRVLVIGASSGIGRSFAQQALAAGARVVITARRAERLDEIVGSSPDGVAVTGDVRDRDDCLGMVSEAARSLGELDLIVYAAGAASLRPLMETTDEDWAVALETHVMGVHHVVQAALGHMA